MKILFLFHAIFYSKNGEWHFRVFFEDNVLLQPRKAAERTCVPLWRPLEVFLKPETWIIFFKTTRDIISYLVKTTEKKADALTTLGFAAKLLNINSRLHYRSVKL